MKHFGLAIHPATNDLYLANTGDLAVVRDARAVGEHVRQRLMTFAGEWFLDTAAGMPWLDRIFAQQYDPALAEAIVKAEILDTEGVREITAFSVSFDPDVRRLNIKDIEVLTIYDETVSV